MIRSLPAPVLKLLPFALPIVAIALARWLTFTDWAQANAALAAILFAWVVADALLLGLLARADNHRPSAFSVLGVLSLVSLILVAGAAAPVRAIYLGLPQVLAAAGGTVALFAGWSVYRIIRTARAANSLQSGLEEVIPGPLLKHIQSEIRVLALGLFRWNAPVDAPQGSKAFAYHTYLTPMLITFVVLQLIELSVVHFLLMLWNPTVAWVLLALSVWGVIWTIALIKSLRINPVLLDNQSVRIRSGMLYDITVARSAIADVDTPFSHEELENKAVLNLALMSSPNVSLRFDEPVRIPTFLGGERRLTGVALRLEDGPAFLDQLKSEI